MEMKRCFCGLSDGERDRDGDGDDGGRDGG